jgi:hypothetical protein
LADTEAGERRSRITGEQGSRGEISLLILFTELLTEKFQILDFRFWIGNFRYNPCPFRAELIPKSAI